MDAAEILSLRHRVSDSVLLDWLDLEQLLPARPCHIKTDTLRRHWQCSQPSVSRRISRRWEAGLLDFRSGGGLYRIRRLGPACDKTSTPASQCRALVPPIHPASTAPA